MTKVLLCILISAQIWGLFFAQTADAYSREERDLIHEQKRDLMGRVTDLYNQYHAMMTDEEKFLYSCYLSAIFMSDPTTPSWLFFAAQLRSCFDAESFCSLLKKEIVGITIEIEPLPAKEDVISIAENILEHIGFSHLPYRAYFMTSYGSFGWRAFAGGVSDPSLYKSPLVEVNLSMNNHISGIYALSVNKLTRGNRFSDDEDNMLRKTAMDFVECYTRYTPETNDIAISEYSYLGNPDEPVAWIWIGNGGNFSSSGRPNYAGLYFLIGTHTDRIYIFSSFMLRNDISEHHLQLFAEESE